MQWTCKAEKRIQCHTKKAISEGQNTPREHTTEQGQNPCEGDDGARSYWVAKW